VLREEADFLDYCVYHVLGKLEANQSRPPALYVDVITDIQSEESASRIGPQLTARRSLNDEAGEAYKDPRAASRVREVFAAISDLQKNLDKMERAKRAEAEAELDGLRSEVLRLRKLADQENRLMREIQARLARAGVSQIERSNRAFVLTDKISGSRWQRPSAKDAAENNLVPASHLLITELRTPETSGRYQMSMRLIDVSSGIIVWTEQGDRLWAPSPVNLKAEPTGPVPSPTVLLQSGVLNGSRSTHLARTWAENGDRAYAARDYPKAVEYYTLAIKNNPKNVQFILKMGHVADHLGSYAVARAYYEHALTMSHGITMQREVLNNLSWLLSTCPDASVRDGKRALELALRMALTLRKNHGSTWMYWDTVAAAYAESGDFDLAVATLDSARFETMSSGIEKLLAERKRDYRDHKPYRDTPELQSASLASRVP
jgi:tetratricopeptide (TPR) repeat protein